MEPRLETPLAPSQAPDGPRALIVGDVHACGDELEALLRILSPGVNDRVIFLGDLVDRGPSVRKVFDLVREARGELVLGNHEDKFLQWREQSGTGESRIRLAPHHQATLDQLRPGDWELMESAHPYLELTAHGAVVVHAGMRPGLPLKEQSRDDLCRLQSIGRSGRRRKWGTAGAVFWASVCDYDGWVIYGHTHVRIPIRFERTLGIDTGCCFGGSLTALELPSGRLHQVRGRRNYVKELYENFYPGRARI